MVNIAATTQLQVVLVRPEKFENASEIADHLREKRTVVLNLEQTSKDVSRRILDFLVYTRKRTIVIKGLTPQGFSVNQKYHLIGIMGTSNKLSGFEAGQRLSGASRMPDMPAQNVRVRPVLIRNLAGDACSGIILVAAHHLERVILRIRNRIKADECVCHWDVQELCDDILPIVDGFVIEIRPMEVERLVEYAVRSGIGEVYGFFRFHCNEDLHQRKESGKNAFMGILFNLMISVADGNSTSL